MITHARLKSLLIYDPATGTFTWNQNRGGQTSKGSVAGCVDGNGYIVIRVDQQNYRAHRLAWLYVHGKFPTHEIDHIDGVRINNRIKNLRDVIRQENNKNRRISSNNTSGTMGVSWCARLGKWRSYVTVDLKQIHLGVFEELEDAVIARKKAEKEHGFNDNHGRS